VSLSLEFQDGKVRQHLVLADTAASYATFTAAAS
jgi:hypothetical protein